MAACSRSSSLPGSSANGGTSNGSGGLGSGSAGQGSGSGGLGGVPRVLGKLEDVREHAPWAREGAGSAVFREVIGDLAAGFCYV